MSGGGSISESPDGCTHRDYAVKMGHDLKQHVRQMINTPTHVEVSTLHHLQANYVDATRNLRFSCAFGSIRSPHTLAAQCASVVANTRRLTAECECECWQDMELPRVIKRLIQAAADAAKIITTTRNPQSHNGTLLSVVCLYHMQHVVERLLDMGADSNTMDCQGATPMHNNMRVTSVTVDTNARILRIMHMLLAAGAHVNVQNRHGESPLSMAVGRGALDRVDVLLSANARLSGRVPNGWSILGHAIYIHKFDIARCLIKYGATFDKMRYQEALVCRRVALDGGALDIVAAFDAYKITWY